MLHPFLAKAIRSMLVVSGVVFSFLMLMTAAGIVLIELNGGTV